MSLPLPSRRPPKDPLALVIEPTVTGFTITWGLPEGCCTDTINRYAILYQGYDNKAAYVETIGVRGATDTVEGLMPGHRYVIAVETWNE